MKRFYLRIILPTTLSILLFIITIYQIIIPRFQETIMDGKREMIRELTHSAISILSKCANDEREGLLSREEAQKNAISSIQYLRYGEEGKDYFWITDMHPVMVIHPHRTDLNGKDLSNFKDPHGKRMFVEFVETAKKHKAGYVDYMWQWKDDSTHIVPKLSYVELFEAWNWIVGTGVYIEDVRKETAALTQRLITISIGISILMALLLLYILKQSITSERQRISAENELHESREKYRTLVEAATEGLIMLIDGRISFSNAVTAKITGFDSEELHQRRMKELIATSNPPDVIKTFSGDTIEDGQYNINLQQKSGTSVQVLITSSTALFYDRTVNIIIIKDISSDNRKDISNIDLHALLKTRNLGFFKINIDRKGKFVFASDKALRILGYDRFEELSDVGLQGLLKDPAERIALRKLLQEEGSLVNKVLKIQKRDNEAASVLVSLVVTKKEGRDEMICDGIIEDVSFEEREKLLMRETITRLKTSEMLTTMPLREFLRPLITLDADASIALAIELMDRKKSNCLLLTNAEKSILGIITRSDIQRRVLALNLSTGNPAYLIMSSPVQYFNDAETVGAAMKICSEKGMNYPVIKDGNGDVRGVVYLEEVYKAILTSRQFLLERIQVSHHTSELKSAVDGLHLIVKTLVREEIGIPHITRITASFADTLCRRIIELALEELGPPPARFCFICLGSEGRREETLNTDQDNAIIYESLPRELGEYAQQYFLKLGESVCHDLNELGYPFCKGNIMAMNPQWCKPLDVWEGYFMQWITEPDAQNLLDASVFFDLRCIYGDEALAEGLKEIIAQGINKHSVFLYHLALNTYQIKVPPLPAGSFTAEKAPEYFDLKAAMVPLIMFARVYALQHNVISSNTIERIQGLRMKNSISSQIANDFLFIYKYLMTLRFRTQVWQSDNRQPFSNMLTLKTLSEMEVQLLRKSLAQIPDFQDKLKIDFRLMS